MMKKYYILLFIGLVALLYFVYYKSVNAVEITQESKIEPIKITNRFPTKENIKNIVYNKTIIVGDSRMSLMKNRSGEINIPDNFIFIAVGGTKIDWFSEYATERLEDNLDNKDENYLYHVLINMGVNDLDSDKNPVDISNDYYLLYYKLAKKYPSVKFYLLSVNPIDEKIIYKKISNTQLRTLNKIVSFNNQLQANILNSKVDNIKYCDSFNNLNFATPDGLHYDSETDKKIIDFMVNDCLVYE